MELHTFTYTRTHSTPLMLSQRSRPVPGCRIMCAEACLAWMLVMDSVRLARLAEAPQSGAICQPTRCQQRQRYKYLTLGELCLYAPSKRAQGRDNGVRETGASVTSSCMLICFSSSFSSLFLSLCLAASPHKNNNSAGQCNCKGQGNNPKNK